MDGTDKPIIQAEESRDFAPLSNRGKVGANRHMAQLSTPYWFASVRDPEHLERVHSVDMVRLALHLDYHTKDHDMDFGSWVDFFHTWTRADFADVFESTTPGKYRVVVSLLFEAHHVEVDEDGNTKCVRNRKEPTACNVTVGLGFNKDKSVDFLTGFIEFNPNKSAKHAYYLLDHFQSRYKVRYELSRWDYAVDVPIARSSVLVARDSRKYECHISNACTTYLGMRNQVGRVKVYDKTAESHLTQDWTRIEVTYGRPCQDANGFPMPPTPSRWPMVGQVVGATVSADPDPESAEKTTSTSNDALICALTSLHKAGQDIEPYLQMLESHRLRPKIRRALVPCPIEFSETAWLACARIALAWEQPNDGILPYLKRQPN